MKGIGVQTMQVGNVVGGTTLPFSMRDSLINLYQQVVGSLQILPYRGPGMCPMKTSLNEDLYVTLYLLEDAASHNHMSNFLLMTLWKRSLSICYLTLIYVYIDYRLAKMPLLPYGFHVLRSCERPGTFQMQRDHGGARLLVRRTH